MILFYLVIAALTIYGFRYCHIGFHNDYLGKEQSQAVKGLFILIVFFRHIFPYIQKAGYPMTSIPDKLFLDIDSQIGQLLVVMFLFYSGYGVTESIKKKGKLYINTFPKKRLLTTLLNYDIAVLSFIIIDVILEIKLNCGQIVLSFLCWESIGNSNWYIFIILFCYFLTYLSFHFWSKWYVTLTLILSVIAVLILFYVKPTWWYDTLLCYPAGMYWSIRKEQIESLFQKHYGIVFFFLIITFLTLHLSNIPYAHGLTYNAKSIIFSILVVTLTMKIHISNFILCWLGIHLFPLYIYQRLPMVILSQIKDGWLPFNHPYLYVTACLVFTIIIAHYYKYWQIQFK